ncbi:MAG: hypothetical protein AAGF91_08450, partial [Actinomycetota bacterium]
MITSTVLWKSSCFALGCSPCGCGAPASALGIDYTHNAHPTRGIVMYIHLVDSVTGDLAPIAVDL